MDNSSSTSSSQQVSPPHTSSLRTEDSQPPMLGQESVDGMHMAFQNVSTNVHNNRLIEKLHTIDGLCLKQIHQTKLRSVFNDNKDNL